MELTARVWFEVSSACLLVEINGIIAQIDFHSIPEDDFESAAPITRFSLGCEGTVVICHHGDGEETWLPVDMWLPGGFTPQVNGIVRQPQPV
ncbi:MAG: hypothetical protein DYG89_51870 [Caldilinea sp. CFX5]|nr:hypothetical protein [Caldilinea sp. CFX5]